MKNILAFLLAVPPAAAFMNMPAVPPAAANKLMATGLPSFEQENKGLDNVFAQNQVWKASKLAEDRDFFKKLGTTHTPEFMYIGCADARVPPNSVIGEDAGNMFVHRNVANMVVGTDANCLSALQYGVGYLKVKHILVCGHYECGGIKAGDANVDFDGPLEMWVQNVRDIYFKNREELDAIEDPQERHHRVVELNVEQQVVNVLKTGVVQSRRKQTYEEGGEEAMSPLVHGLVFDPKTGVMKRVEIDWSKYDRKLANVYGLYLV